VMDEEEGMSTQRKRYSAEFKARMALEALKGSPSKVLLFFGNVGPLARNREPVKEGQGWRWRWGKYSNHSWNSGRSV